MQCHNVQSYSICIAGKNNIAVDILRWLLDRKDIFPIADICVVCNSTDTGGNTFQKSLRYFANMWNVPECSLEDVYRKNNLIFLSLEYDKIIEPEKFISARLYNIHFSLLPKYKGMYTAAISILNGDLTSGVTLHRINSGIDTGEIIDYEEFSIKGMTCRDVYLSCIHEGTCVVQRNLHNIIYGIEVAEKQAAIGSSYYSRMSLNFENIKLDTNQTAAGIARQINAYNFREYQLPQYGGDIIGYKILRHSSALKPGSIVYSTNDAISLSTVDYDIVLYYDRLNNLIDACKSGNMDHIRYYSWIPGILNAQETQHGWTALMVAVYNNQKEAVKYLLAMGADVELVNYDGTNILMYAKEAYRRYGDNELFRLFYKLNLNIRANDYTGKSLLDYMEIDGLTMDDLLL